LLQVAALLSAIMRIDSQRIPGYQTLDSSNSRSVLYERILEEMEVAPCPDNQRRYPHQSQFAGSSASSPAALLGFAKKLFEDDNSDDACS
jgi:hypothetical protein